MQHLPAADQVGRRAADILTAINADEEFARLTSSTLRYNDCWKTFTGYALVSEFTLEGDAQPLLVEALRVLSIKSAVLEMTGSEQLAELHVPAPVDEMIHAVLAQHTLIRRLEERLGITMVHMTDQEEFGWKPGDYTEQCYRAAGFGEPPARYWLPAAETMRRLDIMKPRYANIGFAEVGRSSTNKFDDTRAPALV